MLLVWGAVCIGVAAVVGGATGFGAALIATPFMLLAGYSVPEVVVINLVAGVVTRLGVALRLWDRIHWRRVALLVLGSVPGAWIGTLTLPWLPEHQLKQTVGVVVVLCGTGMALARFSRAYTPSADVQLLAGALSGYLSTTTSLNGPPVALLLTRANLPVVVHRRPGGLFHGHERAVVADSAWRERSADRYPLAGPPVVGGHCGAR